jgi:hypothetical protein
VLSSFAAPLAAQEVAATHELFPTAIGTRWVFQSGVIEMIEQVTAHERVGNEVCAKVETVLNGKVVAHEHYAVRADGVYRVAVANQLVEPPFRFMKFPLAINDRWSVNSVVLKQPIAGTFQTTQARVKVPAGEFDTVTTVGSGFKLVIAAADDSTPPQEQPLAFTYSFARGIGKVQQTTTIGTGDAARKIELKLKEFTPARQAVVAPATR